MKKMQPNDLWAWFHQQKCQCMRCFDLNHVAANCHLKTWKPCNKKIEVGDRKGEICGSNEHNIWLHRDPKPPRKQKPQNNSNQTKASTEEGTSSQTQGEEQQDQ